MILTPDDPRFRLPLLKSAEQATLGTFVIGDKGTGKTSVLAKVTNDLLRARCPVIAVDSGDRLADRLAWIAPPGTPVTRFSATKEGGAVADFAKLLHHPTDIVTGLGKLLPGDKNDRNFFFVSLAREFVKAAIGVLNHFVPLKWLPYDLVWLASRPKLLSAVCRETKGAVPDPLSGATSKDANRDVFGTVMAYMSPLSLYAALGDYQPLANPVEVVDTQRGVSVLEWNDRDAAMLEPVIAMVLELAAARAMSRLGPEKYLGLFADELRSYVRLDFPTAVAVRGRRPKIVFCFSLHSVSGLVDRYGEHRCRELLGTMSNKIFLRVGDPITAKFAADVFGKEWFVETVLQPDGRWTRQMRERYLVPSEEFMRLPPPDVARDAIRGYARTPNHCGPFRCKFLADTSFPVPAEPRGVPMGWYTPKPRTEADLQRLNIPLSNAVTKALHDRREDD